MIIVSNTRDTDVPIFMYLMVLATPVVLFGCIINWLLQPLVILPTGSAGYGPDRAPFVLRSATVDESVMMIVAVEKAVAEANLELRAEVVQRAKSEEGVRQANTNMPGQVTRKSTRKVQRVARSPAYPDAFRQRKVVSASNWNHYSSNRYATRWF